MQSLSLGGRNFNISKKLGKGSYGHVYQVNEQGKEYALKVIQTKFIEGIKSLRELDIMSRLSHPYLMHARDIVAESSSKSTQVGILMDLAERDLHTAMYDKELLISERLEILKSITSGLSFLHASDYLHLDIKPLNILLFKNNIARLSDFGLALRTQDVNEKKYKDYPIEIITVSHRSYNVLKGDRRYTIADDIWALGITFFEVLSGGYSLFSKLSDVEYTSENVLKIIEEKLSLVNIDATLNSYFFSLKGKIKRQAINLIKSMLAFDPLLRPNTSQVLASPLFSDVVLRAKEGTIVNDPINKPIACNELIYEGFDILVRLSTRISIKLETFFLAADIYQRSLAYRQPIKGNANKDYTNTVFHACVSLYMAIKMIESYFADIDVITRLAGDLFSPEYLLKGEAALVNSFRGKIYPNNFFTNSTTFRRLEEGFNLSYNCHLYRKINFKEWKALNDVEASKHKNKNPEQIYLDKWGLFIPFLIKVKYYSYLTDATLSYIASLYQHDLSSL